MNWQRAWRLGLFLGALGFATTTGCSDKEATPSTGGPNATADTVTVPVTAAAGGTVEDKAGKVKLTIPAGALAKDTEITLKVSAPRGNAVADVADFGPDGLTFVAPVALEFKADAALAGGDSLAVALEEGGTFKAVPGSTYENGVARANIQHFSWYSLVRVPKATPNPPSEAPLACMDAYDTLRGCGGDPVGTWTVADYCDPSEVRAKMGLPSCAELKTKHEYSNTAVWTLTSSSITLGRGTRTQRYLWTFPRSCAALVCDPGDPSRCERPTCAALSNPPAATDEKKCSEVSPDQCRCDGVEIDDEETETVPFRFSGSTWELGEKDGELCVKGDFLYMAFNSNGERDSMYVLKRKP